MKSTLIFLGMAFSFASFAQKDTIQVKVGDSAEILIIEKQPNGFKEVEKLDLNKVFDEMYQKLQSSNTPKAIVKDYDGDSCQKKKTKLSKWYLNYYIGVNAVGDYSHTEYSSIYSLLNYYAGNPSGVNSIDNNLENKVALITTPEQLAYALKPLKSPYLAVSGSRDLLFLETAKLKGRIVMGGDVFFSYQKYGRSKFQQDEVGTLYRYNSSATIAPSTEFKSSDILATGNVIEGTDNVAWTFQDGLNNLTFTTIPYNMISLGFNLKIVPTIDFNTNSGNRIVSIGIGPIGGINAIGKAVTKIDNETSSDGPVIVGKVEPSVWRYGLIAQLGIGNLTLFGQSNISNVKIYQLEGDTYDASHKGYTKSAVYTVGLKFGK
jgi:hypothetical protein